MVVVWDLCRLVVVGYGFVEVVSIWLRVCGCCKGHCDKREKGEREK